MGKVLLLLNKKKVLNSGAFAMKYQSVNTVSPLEFLKLMLANV